VTQKLFTPRGFLNNFSQWLKTFNQNLTLVVFFVDKFHSVICNYDKVMPYGITALFSEFLYFTRIMQSRKMAIATAWPVSTKFGMMMQNESLLKAHQPYAILDF